MMPKENKDVLKGKRILIIEDEYTSRIIARDFLSVLGCVISEAGDGEEGVACAADFKPDLILMDIQMPVMDGIEATKLLKNDTKTSHIPIIALTACAMADDEANSLSAGCDEYLAKPFDLAQLLAKMKKLLGKSRQ
ncbi:MAG: response regulator [Candidatus Eremiobacteraeota bacterium]|nr:response regulator [Candidatus Eremiobacteraeota bacterium]